MGPKVWACAAVTAAAFVQMASVAVAEPAAAPSIGNAAASPPTNAQCQSNFGHPCYTPAQIETAYGMSSLYAEGLNGAGKTIVIVTPFGSPTITSDLTMFDKAFKLAAPPSFQIIQPAGAVTFNSSDPDELGWAKDATLAVEYAHVMAPGANILLAETPVDENEGTSGFAAIDKAESHVIDNGLGDVISQSFGATEQTFPSAQAINNLRTPFLAAQSANITVLASAGGYGATNISQNPDNGSTPTFFTYKVAEWPATDPLVTAVGGTSLSLNAAGTRTAPDTVWNDTTALGYPAAGGGGVSVDFSRPSYQDSVASVVGGARGIPDVSMSAGVATGGVLIYASYPGTTAGFQDVGGTAEATPEFAGLVAIADQSAGRDLGLINPTLYQNGENPTSGITDITTGDNSVTFTQGGKPITVAGYPAAVGYDLSSGLGTPSGPQFVAALGG